MRILSILCLILALTGCQEKQEKRNCISPIMEVPFDESMGKSESEFRFIFANGDDAARYTKAKALYEKNLPSKIQRSSPPKIPKIIHQIWLGPNLPPSYFYEYQEKWKVLHPSWEYHLWGEEELEKLHLENWDLVEKSPNWAEKSDIIRGDLLNRFGGVYIDVDIEPFHCLDELHEKYDFYAGMEHPHKITTTSNRVWVGISIIGAKPGHPIIQNWKARVRNGWDDVDVKFSAPVDKVVNHTYFPFTHAVMQEADRNGNVDMLFPATYFYPISPSFASKRRSTFRAVREKVYDLLENLRLKRPRAFSRIYPETLAVHYWGNTWLPEMGQQVKEMHRLIDAARKDLYKMQVRMRALERQVSSQEKELEETKKALLFEKEKANEQEQPQEQQEMSLVR